MTFWVIRCSAALSDMSYETTVGLFLRRCRFEDLASAAAAAAAVVMMMD